MTSNPRGERRCMVGVGPQGETTFEPFVRAAWADAEIERLRAALERITEVDDYRQHDSASIELFKEIDAIAREALAEGRENE